MSDNDFEEEENVPEEKELVQPLLKEYVQEQFKRHGHKTRDFVDQGIPHSSMQVILHPHKRVGEHLLAKVAEVFHLPMQTVLEWGEVLPNSDQNTQARRLLSHTYEMLSETGKDQLVNFALFLLDEEKKK